MNSGVSVYTIFLNVVVVPPVTSPFSLSCRYSQFVMMHGLYFCAVNMTGFMSVNFTLPTTSPGLRYPPWLLIIIRVYDVRFLNVSTVTFFPDIIVTL